MLGQVFNYKLGCFVATTVALGLQAQQGETFYVRNLRIFVKSYSVGPQQASPS